MLKMSSDSRGRFASGSYCILFLLFLSSKLPPSCDTRLQLFELVAVIRFPAYSLPAVELNCISGSTSNALRRYCLIWRDSMERLG